MFLEIGIDEALVVAPRNEANLLRVRLVCQREPVFPRQLPHCRLGETPEREEGMRQLLLGQTEKKIGLVLACIRRPLQDPAPPPGSYSLRA